MKNQVTIACLVLIVAGWAAGHEIMEGKMKIDLVRKKIPRSVRDDRTNDSMALYRYLDNEFWGPIQIGGVKSQTMNVAFDTAWAGTWVLSQKCNALKQPACKNHNRYDSTKSSYYKPNGTKYSYSGYEGIFGYENISFAHSNVTNFLFIDMSVVPDNILENYVDGVMGLGLRVSVDDEPFFYTMLREKKIRDPIFSVYLNRDPSSNKGGNILLGYIEQRHIHVTNGTRDDITYLDAYADSEYWKFDIDKITMTLNSIDNVTLCDGCTGITTTSTNNITGPADEIAKIHERIKANELNGRYYVDCNTVNGLVKIDFVLGGTTFRLNGPQYIVKESDDMATYCYSAFVPQDDATDWVVGGAFLSQFYSIYNVEKKQIGFVRAA